MPTPKTKTAAKYEMHLRSLRLFMTGEVYTPRLSTVNREPRTTTAPLQKEHTTVIRRIVSVIAFALLSLAIPAAAQTYTQKTGEVACRIATFECQGIVMTSGDKYTINEPYSQLAPGAQFIWDTTQGAVTDVTEQLPVYWAPGVYEVKYDIELTTGKTATVTSSVRIGRIYRWPEAYVSGTTIVFH